MLRHFFTVFILFPIWVFTQSSEIDSLKRTLNTAESSQERALILNRLGFFYGRSSRDSLIKYTNQSLFLSRKINFPKGIALAHNNFGLLAYSTSNYDSAIFHIQKYLDISLEIESKEDVNKALNNLGIMSKLLGEYSQSLLFFQQALEAQADPEAQAKILNNIGSIYRELGDYTEALQYQFSALAKKEELGMEEATAPTYANIGLIYADMDDLTSARIHFDKALRIYENYGDQRNKAQLLREFANLERRSRNAEIARTYLAKSQELAQIQGHKLLLGTIQNDLGVMFKEEKKHAAAIIRHQAALEFFTEIDHKLGMVETSSFLVDCYLKLEQHALAEKIALSGFTMAQELELTGEAIQLSEHLQKLYTKLGDYKKALEYARKLNGFIREQNRSDQKREVELLQARYQMEKENLLLNIQNEKNQAEIDRNRLQIQRQNLLLYGSAVILTLLIVSLYLGFQFLKKRREIIRVLKEKNQEITAQKEELQATYKELEDALQEIQTINESLEEKIRRRTAKIQEQNEKLKEYAFSNAHLVRAPLARILGLTAILSEDKNLSAEQNELLYESLLKSADELDAIIRKVSELLDS